ncbi:MAG: hypothetical protein MUF72_15255 [Elainella sp. Prado103]|jgi:hypothetical protein|nr:hypothetical protein [Elainella sp. Prado103]
MRPVLLVTAVAVLGFGVAGCNLFGGGDDTTVVEQPVEQPVEVPVEASPEASPGAPAFEQPTVTPKNAPRGILPPDLISSTDPNQRVQQVKGERSDPFSLLPTTPSVQLAEGATPPAPVTVTIPIAPTTTNATAPTGGAQAPARVTPNTPSRSTPESNGGNGGTSPGNNGTANGPQSPIKNTPPRPQPTLARAVKVTGVVQVGDQVYAIVNAPNEPTSRYIQAGQRLAGGEVLVRRIETNRPDPVVVLEQAGVEVVRAVGEGGAAAVSPDGSPDPAT